MQNDKKPVEAPAPSQPTQPDGLSDYSAWLIERADKPQQFLIYGVGMFDWTDNADKSIHFSRRADAEQIAEILENEDIKICEHLWPSQAAQPIASPAPDPVAIALSIPNIIQSPLFTICIDCGREQTLAKGELWPAYCECGGTLAAGHEPLSAGNFQIGNGTASRLVIEGELIYEVDAAGLVTWVHPAWEIVDGVLRMEPTCMCATGQHCSVHSSREDWNPMEGGNCC